MTRRALGLPGGCLAAALLSLLALPAAPGYDAQAWLLWGREVAHLELSTDEGPAFKPLPVLVCALLAPLGELAPEAWLVLARAGALLGVAVAFRLARRVAGGSVLAGGLAATGTALLQGFLELNGAGGAEGLGVALALLATERALAERAAPALLAGLGLALLRVEAWPFLLAAGVVGWRARPALRPLLVLGALAVPALWFGPEWLGSGDPLRSSTRARVPNPGQPALAEVPALASLGLAAAVPLAPLALGALVLLARPRAQPRALAVALAGVAWVLLVAVMSQAGYSGEERYTLPGMALLTVGGAAGLAALGARGWRAVGVVALVALAAVPRLAAAPEARARLNWAARLDGDLARTVGSAGGAGRLLACGRPYVGPLRGPLLAWHVGVEKRRVGFVPRAPGIVFRSRLTEGSAPTPAVPAGFRRVAGEGLWEVFGSCVAGGGRGIRAP